MKRIVSVLVAAAMTSACAAEDQDAVPDAGPPPTERSLSLPDAGPPIDIVITPQSLQVTEGSAATFTMALGSPAAGDVTVALASSSPAVVVSPETLTLTWGVERAITVSAPRDADAAHAFADVSITAPDGHTRYVGVDVRDVDVVVPQIVVSPSSLSVGEGTFARLRVRLSAPPTGPVTLTATARDPGMIRLSSSALTFTAADYDLERMIVVSAVEDLDLVDGHTAVQLAASGLATVVVPVAIDDDDVQTLVITPPQISVLEGRRNGFSVRLAAPPAAPLIVRASSLSPLLAVGVGPMTFTAANWSVAQVVPVQAAQDADRDHHATAVLLAAPGVSSARVSVQIVDDDR